MSLKETSAIVIKTQDYKENDKLVWLFTENFGKIALIAKGAKKSKSKLFSITLPLCYGDYLVFKGKNLYTLSEGRIKSSFQGLLDNLEKLTYSSYLCELIDISMQDEESNKDLYREFVTCLYLLNTDAIDYELLIRSFELKLLKATGYGLCFDNCVFCKKKMNISNFISLSYFGGVCDTCKREHGVYVSKGTYNTLRFINNTPMDKVYRVNVSKEIKDEMFKVTSFIISSSYSKKPKSLEMLNFIKE
ncbi:DNA repair protein RecO [Clostridium cavendishii]|uniref:DNA repair protein RecO n=1 Tax=Clostridium cavendishii TaxID=349931 RepID=UPI000932AC49|nr:DNA repair protein RecO [Clostridium cavendishii]